jgi:bifunctional UDP-N-acetylglucosamine pyrophosphorylase / glucosamine-1-phosphate N-acetyltransferase
MNIVILAAGMGKRMQSSMPKVLHPIAHKPMLQHVLDNVLQMQPSPSKIIIVVGHGAEQVERSIKTNNSSNIIFVKQEQQLGTGHAVMQALPHLDANEPTLVLYGDVPLTTLASLKSLMSNNNNACLNILTAIYDNPTGYGRIVKDEEGHIVSIVEEKDATQQQKGIQEINTGIMLLPTKFLYTWLPNLGNKNAQGEYYLTDVVAKAVEDNIHINCVHPCIANWETFGVNSKAQLADLERIYQANIANVLLKQGATLMDSSRIDVRGNLNIGKDVTIDVGCVFEGSVYLADGVHIKPYCIIKNSTINASTTIEAFSHIDDANIGANNKIGPYARIRPQTHTQNDVHIGNFVELKNTKVDNASKINHLSYMGDAVIGANVNIGAGVITCNYDGVNKYLTHIEDNCFIGSDVQLIAPVKIEQGATIGAGSTITKTAKANALTLSRAKQISIEDWQRPVKIAKVKVNE